MNYLPFIIQGMHALALLSTGIIYGTDVFFALIGKKAGFQSQEWSLLDYLGNLHSVADKRMPIIGVISILSTISLVLLHGLYSISGRLFLIALLGLFTQLSIYLTVAKPVNVKMIDAAKFGRFIPDARALQTRWDSVITYRAVALSISMICLTIA